MRIIRMALAALFAVLAFSAIAASGASAAGQPLFLNGNGNATLSFTGTGGTATLRGLNLSTLGTIVCEKNSASGETVNKSMEAKKVVFEFTGKCEQTVGSTKTACTEPIKTKATDVQLGLASSTVKTVLELVAPESGTEFVKVVCGSNTTTVEGSVVGEVPTTNKAAENQLNSQRSSLESVFAVQGTTENQLYSGLLLLGTQMSGLTLKVAGFFGGTASQEGSGTTKPPANGTVELSTKF